MEAPVPQQPAPEAMAPTGSAPPVAPIEGNAEENSSLYVGDLDKDVQETHLFDVFSQVGPVHSIRVCRDTVTRRSLGYAYVNYNVSVDPDAAKNAKENLNYKEINGKPIRIMWANRNPNARKNKDGNIFIKNLEKDVTTRMLHDTFSSFGTILSCKVALDKDLKSKGYGFVHFEEADSAKRAIADVDGMRLGESDKVVRVTEFLSRTERGDAKSSYTNLYVKNLPETVTTQDDLTKLFADFGTISSAVIMKDNKTDRYFGFVNFETAEAAVAAKEKLHDSELDGSKLFVDRAQTKAERSDMLKRRYEQKRSALAQEWEGKNVYVKNLSAEVDETMLKEAFAEFGEIVNTKIMRDANTKVPRGFGFVCFSSAEDAAKAVGEMNSRVLDGKKLYVAFAQSKAARAAQMQNVMKSSMVPAQMAMAYGGRGMGQLPPAMQGAVNMGYMQPYAGMVPYGLGRGQMMANPMAQFQMGGGGGMQNGARGANGVNPMAMQGNMPMQMLPPGMMAPGMMGPAGMMAPAMGGQRGRGGGRGGRGRGAQGPGGPAGPGRMPGFVGGGRAGGRAGPGGRGGMPPGGATNPMAMPPPEPQLPSAPEAEESNLAAKLASMAEPAQKQHLGELLFPRVQDMLTGRFGADNAAKLASKVTGMFLEMDTPGLLYLLDTDTECSIKIEEALDVLRQHNAMPDGCA